MNLSWVGKFRVDGREVKASEAFKTFVKCITEKPNEEHTIVLIKANGGELHITRRSDGKLVARATKREVGKVTYPGLNNPEARDAENPVATRPVFEYLANGENLHYPCQFVYRTNEGERPYFTIAQLRGRWCIDYNGLPSLS